MNYKLLSFLFFLIPTLYANSQKGFCCIPVVDLVGQKLSTEQPYADAPGDHYCTRLSQLLFNEQVEIVDETDTEYKVKIYHLYYNLGAQKTKQTIYRVDKKAIILFKKLSHHAFSKIPPPLSFETVPQENPSVITLLLPFTDPKTNLTYSAGTRFVKTEQQLDTKTIAVYCFNPKKKQFKIIALPRSICLEHYPKTAQQKRTLFLDILHKWIPKNGYIPYVFGGASIDHPLTTNFFYEEKIGSATIYQRPEADFKTKYGIDCSQLIARAAQIVGINYYLKNSTTILQELSPITYPQKIENGDIIVWPGHTCIISNVKKGLIIEARGYEHGYGIVQEIPLHEQFHNVHSFKQLQKMISHNQTIIRLNKAGNKVQTIKNMKIMKLPV